MQRLASLPTIWGVPATITTGLGLAALCVLTAYLLARAWLRGRQRTISEAIKSEDKRALALLIGASPLELAQLDAGHTFLYARERLALEYRARIFGYSILALLFALIVVLVLVPMQGRVEERDGLAALSRTAFDTFSGRWTIDGDCENAMRFRVNGGVVSVQNPEPDDAVVFSFTIGGPYRNGIWADDDGLAVRLWSDGKAMVYEHGGESQRFVRCADAV